jgi:hypothetical protein
MRQVNKRKGCTMDNYCPKCGEPWDIDSLHEEVLVKMQDSGIVAGTKTGYEKLFDAVRKDFYRRGCPAAGGRCSEPDTTTDNTFGLTRAEASSSLMEMLGDDIDGVASMLDDMRF